jgi:predicted metalloprotease with PDZ domain
LEVDATDAPRKILHARQSMWVSPDQTTLFYPKWIPGEHGPTGPITDLSGLKLAMNGKPLAWRRDDVDMFAFHFEVPEGGGGLTIEFDFLLPTSTEGFSGSASSTPNLLVLSWNQVLLYQPGRDFKPSLKLPPGWKHGTALPVDSEADGVVTFKPVSLTTLVDSPVVIGRHFRNVPLSQGSDGNVGIAIVADSEGALAMNEDTLQGCKRLVSECDALFGARHFTNYTFLLTLSDHVSHFGLEHHESSDNRIPERTLIDADPLLLNSDLLPHEFVHSWNGKYRRPAGLVTSDPHQPMKGELLWVYEGLTEYLGELLTARSGLWTADTWRDHLAVVAARLDRQPGRAWRPLLDTAVSAQLLYNASGSWAAHRRGVDFYDEGELIWLEADVLIRSLTNGEKSLNDFCRAFFGGKGGAPEVKPYGFDDVIAAMNEVAPHDWKKFFVDRLSAPTPRAPLGGIENGGWKLVYNDVPNPYILAYERHNGGANLSYSIGLKVSEDGTIGDVLPGTSAFEAGLGPAMKITAVSNRRFSVTRLCEAVRDAKGGTDPIELIVENGDFYRVHKIVWNGGEAYPHLERDESKPDVLSRIVRPLASTRAPR